jgi:hypothetical protein
MCVDLNELKKTLIFFLLPQFLKKNERKEDE